MFFVTYINNRVLIWLISHFSRKMRVYTIAYVLEITVEIEKANQQFAKVDFANLFRNLLGLQIRYYHQE